MKEYIIAVETMFRVPAESESEAIQILSENIGAEPFVVNEFEVVEEVE